MKIKLRNYCLIVFMILNCVLYFLPFLFKTKEANAYSIANNHIFGDEICLDIKDGYTGTCYPNNEIVTMSSDNTKFCNEFSTSHGPGRETGGVGLLDAGCRNYMAWSFTYGATYIPYWINMSSINEIANLADRQQILLDIREQTEMWNHAYMFDGTGQIVNIYEITSDTKPNTINSIPVIEVLQKDIAAKETAGLFNPETFTVELDYDDTYKKIGYNKDTVAHEFGHVLGLNDIDVANKVDGGTHKTLMGYYRGTKEENLKNAIKYQDVQGIAVVNGRHTCQDSHFMRYVKVGNEYRHICFYCDRIKNEDSIIPGSEAIYSETSCAHYYNPMVACGERRWDKCTKCYKVIETSNCIETGTHTETCKNIDSLYHNIVCKDCGKYFRTEPHTESYESFNASRHNVICGDCGGYIRLEYHTTNYQSIDSSRHSITCSECGYIRTESHTVSYQNIDTNHHNVICSDCGGHIRTESHTVAYQKNDTSQHNVICSDCGSHIRTEPHANYYIYRSESGHEAVCEHCGTIQIEAHTFKRYIGSDGVGQICTGCMCIKFNDGTWLIPYRDEDKYM